MLSVIAGAVGSTSIALNALIECGCPPSALFTLPLDKSDRHSDFVDLRLIASENKIPLVEVSNLNSKRAIDELKRLAPDYVFVIGWSQLCKKEFLSIPKYGCIGYHPAPLPENRGRAVIAWTILQKRKDTAGTLFWLDEGADSGDILIQEHFNITPNETVSSLMDKHMIVLNNMLKICIPKLRGGIRPRYVQDHSKATYCAKRTARDGYIDWSLSSDEIWTLIRAVSKPYPGAFTFYHENKIIIWVSEPLAASRYFGRPGQIVDISETGVLIICGHNTLLRLIQYEMIDPSNNIIQPVFKLHDVLGIDILNLYELSKVRH